MNQTKQSLKNNHSSHKLLENLYPNGKIGLPAPIPSKNVPQLRYATQQTTHLKDCKCGGSDLKVECVDVRP